jgi:hypothetical protein
MLNVTPGTKRQKQKLQVFYTTKKFKKKKISSSFLYHTKINDSTLKKIIGNILCQTFGEYLKFIFNKINKLIIKFTFYYN